MRDEQAARLQKQRDSGGTAIATKPSTYAPHDSEELDRQLVQPEPLPQ